MEPDFCQGLERWRKPIQPVRECLVAGQLGKPLLQMVFRIFINRLLLKSPLADSPQVYCYTLLFLSLFYIISPLLGRGDLFRVSLT